MDYEFNVIKNIQSMNSEESVIMQLADLLIGAIGYRNRKVYDFLISLSKLIIFCPYLLYEYLEPENLFNRDIFSAYDILEYRNKPKFEEETKNHVV